MFSGIASALTPNKSKENTFSVENNSVFVTLPNKTKINLGEALDGISYPTLLQALPSPIIKTILTTAGITFLEHEAHERRINDLVEANMDPRLKEEPKKETPKKRKSEEETVPPTPRRRERVILEHDASALKSLMDAQKNTAAKSLNEDRQIIEVYLTQFQTEARNGGLQAPQVFIDALETRMKNKPAENHKCRFLTWTFYLSKYCEMMNVHYGGLTPEEKIRLTKIVDAIDAQKETSAAPSVNHKVVAL